MTKIAQIASTNLMTFNRNGVETNLKLSKKALEKLCKTVVGKPITLSSGSTEVGRVIRSWIENNDVFVEFEGETFEKKYLVPAIKAASTVNNIVRTAICTSLILTDEPADRTLLTLSINKIFYSKDELLYFLDEVEMSNGPYESFYDVNKAMLEYSKLL